MSATDFLFAPRRRPPAKVWEALPSHGFTLAILAIWQIASGFLPPYYLPSPMRVATNLYLLVSTHDGLRHIGISLLDVGTAMTLAFAVATVVSLLPFYFPIFRLAVDARITPFLNCFPAIGWTMLAIMWLGVGFKTVIFSVTIILLPFMIINLREGIAALDQELIEMGRSFTRSRWLVFFRIIVPLLVPFAFAAIRVSFGVSWKVTLTAELLGGGDGLGYLINIARQELNTAEIVAIIIVIILLVFVTNRYIFDPVHRKLGTIRR